MRDKKSSETNKIVENVKPSIKLSTISTDSGSFALSALSFADGQLFTVSFDSSFFSFPYYNICAVETNRINWKLTETKSCRNEKCSTKKYLKQYRNEKFVSTEE